MILSGEIIEDKAYVIFKRDMFKEFDQKVIDKGWKIMPDFPYMVFILYPQVNPDEFRDCLKVGIEGADYKEIALWDEVVYSGPFHADDRIKIWRQDARTCLRADYPLFNVAQTQYEGKKDEFQKYCQEYGLVIVDKVISDLQEYKEFEDVRDWYKDHLDSFATVLFTKHTKGDIFFHSKNFRDLGIGSMTPLFYKDYDVTVAGLYEFKTGWIGVMGYPEDDWMKAAYEKEDGEWVIPSSNQFDFPKIYNPFYFDAYGNIREN